MSLVVDDRGVRRQLQDGRNEGVDWDEVTEVEVITTSVGVHKDDGVLVVLCTTRPGASCRRSCVAQGLFGHLDRLPGFDHRARGSDAAPGAVTAVLLDAARLTGAPASGGGRSR